MGGGRDNSGALRYKRENGKYIRVGSQKKQVNTANKQTATKKPMTIGERVADLQKRFIGKKFRLKKDVEVHQYPYASGWIYPTGTEGVLLQVKAFTSGGSFVLGGKTIDGGPKMVHYQFLLDLGTERKWFSSSDIEPKK